MPVIRTIFIAVGLAMTVVATPVVAQASNTPAPAEKPPTIRYIKATPDAIAEVLRYNGYSFKHQIIAEKPVLTLDIDGLTSVIHFNGVAPDYDSVQFYAGFVAVEGFDAGRLNEWNKTRRFSRAYIDDAGDPVLEMDLNFKFGGLSERQFEDWLSLWEESALAFREFVYAEGDAVPALKQVK